MQAADKLIAEAGVDMKYEVGTMIEIPRAAADGRRDRQGGRVLLLRHQRPDADDLRLQPRRRGQVPRAITTTTRSTSPTRSRTWTRTAWASWWRWLRSWAARPVRTSGPGHLRRARRRPDVRRVLPQRGPGLCVLLPLPRAHRAPCRRTGCY